jgi:hypothetical protein
MAYSELHTKHEWTTHEKTIEKTDFDRERHSSLLEEKLSDSFMSLRK